MDEPFSLGLNTLLKLNLTTCIHMYTLKNNEKCGEREMIERERERF